MDIKTLCRISTVEGHTMVYDKKRDVITVDPQYGGTSYNGTAFIRSLNQALVQAGCTTVKRVAMWFGQVGAECGSFRWREELASGAEYNWRSDLGNNQPGDGERFKGRGVIQVTGRHNYTRLSAWAFKHGYVPTKNYFVKNPRKLATIKYMFLGAVWYWTVARNMNRYADANDIYGATRAVNGGTNNLSGRTKRWKRALAVGKAILPSRPVVPAPTKPRPPVVNKPKPPVKPAPAKPVQHKPTPKPAPKPVNNRPKVPEWYTVRSGDNLTKIAQRYHIKGGYMSIYKLNRNTISNPNSIYVGERIRLHK